MKDTFGRDITYLRLSVTDSCNLHCSYCTVGESKAINRLTTTQVSQIALAAKETGFKKIRITGGEPLLHPDIVEMVALVHKSGIEQIGMTTNGVMLQHFSMQLAQAGLQEVNVSLDTLNPILYKKITGTDCLSSVRDGMESAKQAGLAVKLNCVLGDHTDWYNLCQFAKEQNLPIRFIERMPFGTPGIGKRMEGFLALLEQAFGQAEKRAPLGAGPAVYYSFPQGLVVGLIQPMTEPFCEICNRIRVTAKGNIQPCLCFGDSILCEKDVISQDNYREWIKQAILEKPKSHDFLRLESSNRRPGMDCIGG